MAEQLSKREQELREEALALEIEERKQAIESKKISDELARIELAEKKQVLDTRKNAKVIAARDAMKADADRRAIQARCNHHLGGEGAMALLNGAGDMDRKPCVSGTRLPGDIVRIDCNRCSKEWFSNKPGFQEGFALFVKSGRQMGEVGYLRRVEQQVIVTA
jgi:hypothetical protein